MKTLHITKSNDLINSLSFYQDQIEKKVFLIDHNKDIFIAFANEFYQHTLNSKISKDFIYFAHDAFNFYQNKENTNDILLSNVTSEENCKTIKFKISYNDLLLEGLKNLLNAEKIQYKLLAALKPILNDDQVIVYIVIIFVLISV